MDIKNSYAFENLVAKIFSEAGYTVRQGVQLENKTGDIDIIAEIDKRIYCVEVKYSRITERAMQRICDIAESNKMIPLLVTAYDIDEKRKEYYLYFIQEYAGRGWRSYCRWYSFYGFRHDEICRFSLSGYKESN